MSAVIVKGIIISLSVCAAVGIALQQPEVRDWIEEQRRRLAELLRSVTEGLDADTRREAEAFAFEGRMPSQRAAEGAENAIALASGRDTDGDTLGRRMTRQTSSERIDNEERQRLGREYLARRNQELLDMRNRRSGILPGTEKSITPGAEDLLKAGSSDNATSLNEKAVPLAIAAANLNSLAEHGVLLGHDKKNQSTTSQAPTTINETVPAPDAFNAGAHFGNPFGDEYATSDLISLDRSATPKPPVPPKVPVSPVVRPEPVSIPVEAIAEAPRDLSYDEQLARALSLSLAEDEEKARKTLRRTMTEEEAFARAIAESLKDAGSAPQKAVASSSASQGPDFSNRADQDAGLSSNNPWRTKSDDEELYTLTPMPTGQVRRSRILEHDSDSLAAALSNHARKTAAVAGVVAAAEMSELSKATPDSRTASPQARSESPKSATLSPLLVSRDNISSGFNTDSDMDDYASLPGSSNRSVGSVVEVEDVDIESMDDDDGIATPSSWSEVSSQVDEHERSENEAGQVITL